MVGPFWGEKATEDFRGPRWSAPILGRFWRARQNARAPSVRAAFGRPKSGPPRPGARGAPEDDFRSNRHGGAEEVPNSRWGSAAAKGNSAPSIPPPAEPRKPTPTDKRAKRGDSKRERFPDFHCPRGCQPARSGLTFGGKHGSNGQREILGTPGGTRRFRVRFTTPAKSPLLQAGRRFFGAPKSRKPCPGEGRHQKCRFPRIAAK